MNGRLEVGDRVMLCKNKKRRGVIVAMESSWNMILFDGDLQPTRVDLTQHVMPSPEKFSMIDEVRAASAPEDPDQLSLWGDQ